MTASVQHIVTYQNGFQAFLVTESGIGTVLELAPPSPNGRRIFGDLCACCMDEEVRKDILIAVQKARAVGKLTGKVRWCSHHENGETIPTKVGIVTEGRLGNHDPLQLESFELGDARELSHTALAEVAFKVTF